MFTVLVFATLCLVWSSTWLAIKVGLRFLPPFTFAGISFATAALALLLTVKLLHAHFPRDWISWGTMIFLGVFQIGMSYGFTFWGEQYISSGLSAVLSATASVFVVLFAHFLIKGEKITAWKIIGIVTSFVGMTVMFWHDFTTLQNSITRSSLYGELAMLAGAASAAVAIVVYKRFCKGVNPVINSFVQTFVGSTFLLSLGLIWEPSSSFGFTPVATVAVLYLGLGTALPLIGFYWLLGKTSATNVSMILFITPILALVFGWMFLSEALNTNAALGTMLILTGVYLTVRSGN